MTTRLRAGLADLATAATAVDLRDRVQRGARRVVRRNQALGAAAFAVLVTGSLAGYLTLWPAGLGTGPGIQPGSSPPIVVTTVDLADATFVVPAYPGPWAEACPAGERTFADRIADLGPGSKLVIADAPELRGDLDGAPGEEIVIMVQCATEGASQDNPLALRIGTDGAVTALGWVNVDADGELLLLDRAEPVEISGGAVRVVVLGRGVEPQRRDKQTRAFAYRDGRMVQVDGPTTFAPPTTDASAIDLTNTTLYVSTNDEVTNGLPDTYAGYVRLTDGSGGAHLEKIVDGTNTGGVYATVTVVDALSVLVSGRLTPVAVLEVTPVDAPPRSVVMAYHHNELNGYAAQEPWTVFTTAPGAARPSVTVGTDQELIVTTGAQTHTFRFYADGGGWNPWFEDATG